MSRTPLPASGGEGRRLKGDGGGTGEVIGPVGVLFGDHLRFDWPLDAEGGIVVADAGGGTGRKTFGGVVVNLGVVLKGDIALGEAFRHVDGFVVRFSKFNTEPFLKGG